METELNPENQTIPSPSTETCKDDIATKEGNLSKNEVDKTEEAGSRLYIKGKELLAKMEMRRKSVPLGCTFSPAVNKTKSKSVCIKPEEHGDRFEKLYRSAEKTKEKIENLRNSTKPNYSFTPEITSKGRRLLKKKDCQHKSTFDGLYEDASRIREKLKEKQKILEKEAGTFTPKINKVQGKPITPISRRFNPEEEKARQEKLREKHNKHEMEECTFKPKINNYTPSKKRSPVAQGAFHERLYEAEKQRQEKIDRLRKEKEDKELAGITFAPSITKTPISSKKRSSQPLYERLHNSGSKNDVFAEREQKKREEESKYTFKPNISKTAKLKQNAENGENIHTRLYKEAARKKENIKNNEELKKLKETNGCTFSPNITESSKRIISTKHENEKGDKSAPIWDRLAKEDRSKKIEKFESKKSELELKDCTFSPAISNNLKIKGNNNVEGSDGDANSPFWERLHNSDQKKKLDDIDKKKQELELQHCTFSPNITKSKKVKDDNQSQKCTKMVTESLSIKFKDIQVCPTETSNQSDDIKSKSGEGSKELLLEEREPEEGAEENLKKLSDEDDSSLPAEECGNLGIEYRGQA